MDYLHTLFIDHSALQAIIVISLISAIGLMLGRIRVLGISLGITFVFFTGILAGHFGLTIDSQMLFYAETFGLVLFVYALGLQVGPGFFSSMRSEGTKLLLPAIGVLLTGTLFAVALSFAAKVAISDMSGILCGATTNTPALAAAQQTLKQLGVESSGAALSCALTYPLGVVGVIFAMIFLRKVFVKPSDMPLPDNKHKKNVFIASYCVTNPEIFGKTISEIHDKHNHFVISRMWHDGHVLIPMSDRVLQENDILLVITKPEETESLRHIFGKQEEKDWNNTDIDWNKIDSELTSQRIIVTRPEINGKKLSSLRLRNNYGINISRVYRSEVQLLAT
ncbi:MAG: transporter, partial [Bacteroidaceae bacterium]|nr:transporter [Bacteroidaceae bacterium]